MEVQGFSPYNSDLSFNGNLPNLGNFLLDLPEEQRMNCIGQFMMASYQKMETQDQEIEHLRGKVQKIKEENKTLKKCCYEMQNQEIVREAKEKIQVLQTQLNRLNLKSGTLNFIKIISVMPTALVGFWLLEKFFPYDEMWVSEKMKLMLEIVFLNNIPQIVKDKELKQEIDDHIEKLISHVNQGFELRREALKQESNLEEAEMQQLIARAFVPARESLKDLESKIDYFKAKASINKIYT